IHAESPQGILRMAAHSIERKVPWPAGIAAPSQFGGDKDGSHRTVLSFCLAQETSDKFLAASAAINVRGIEEGDATVVGGMEGSNSLVRADAAPIPAELPAAQSNFTHRRIREWSCPHTEIVPLKYQQPVI